MNTENNSPQATSSPTPPLRTKPKTSRLAVTSLVIALFGIPLLWFLGLPAVICGHVARARIKKSNGTLDGDTLVGAGLALGYLELLGIVALSLSIPALEKVHKYTPEKAVLNNVRQLAAAADQYYLEHGAQSCRSEDLIGPTNYVKYINIVAGEKYPDTFVQGRVITVTGVEGARTITYAP